MAGGSSPAVAKDFEALFRVGSAAGLPDGRLLDRFADGPGAVAEAAFAALVERHGSMVLRVCRQVLGDPHDAEDAAQAAFLVLARKARSIRRSDSVASWLHGVAFRVATRAKADAARRRNRERRGAELAARPEGGDGPSEAWPELHEELGRLPEKFRLPIVLCHLEGLSHEQAAGRLGCPVRTVQSRLSRGRERLRARLARRGLGPAAGLVAAALTPDAASATMPGAWTHATSMAAARYAAGGASAAVSEEVAALAGGVLKAMMLKKLKSAATAAALIVVAACGLGTLARPEPPPPSFPTPPAGRYRATTPRGGTFEVVGVSTYPSGPKTWWRPDGSALAEAPYDKIIDETNFWYMDKAAPDYQRRVLAVRYLEPADGAGDDPVFSYNIEPEDGNPARVGRAGRIVPRLTAVAFLPPADRLLCTVKCGITDGPWTTDASHDGRESKSLQIPPDSPVHLVDDGRAEKSLQLSPSTTIVFAKARASGGKASIAVAENIRAFQVRVVAIDRSGAPHPPTREEGGGRGGDGHFTLHDVSFDLDPGEVKEYRVQSRRAGEPVEIRNIALYPRRVAN